MRRRGVCASKILYIFCPQHDSILGIYSNEIYHGICKNIRYTQVGVVLITIIEIANVGVKRQRNLKFE
jgi:hypothetical protein